MPRATLDLQNAADPVRRGRTVEMRPRVCPRSTPRMCRKRSRGFAPAVCPITTIPVGKPARTWARGRRRGVSFVWYRIKATLPETVGGRPLEGARCLFESCIDDYGEIWINGECDRERATVQGFNVPQRVVVSTEPKPRRRGDRRHPGDERPAGRTGRRGVRALRYPGLRVARSRLLSFKAHQPGV